MKQAMNFRLSVQSAVALNTLSAALHISKTQVVEQALKLYAIKKLNEQSRLLKYAGMFSDQEAQEMLTTIKQSKISKKLKVNL